jgi:hypothetical protein
VGATLGSALDAIHSHFGAISYTHPVVAKAAWWVPLLFALAYAGGIARPLLAREEPRPPPWKVALGMGLFIAAYWLTVAPWSTSVRCALLGAIFVASWASCDRTRLGLVLAALAAVLGPSVEIALVHAGVFVHHEVLVFGIPAWLPLLYLSAAVGLGGLARWLAAEREAGRGW